MITHSTCFVQFLVLPVCPHHVCGEVVVMQRPLHSLEPTHFEDVITVCHVQDIVLSFVI